MSDGNQGPSTSSRRQLLRALAGAGLLVGGAGATACGGADDEAAVRVPISRLPEGERVRVMLDGDPVELVRVGQEVRARSLLCTHFGCEVRWLPDQGEYLCPCHQGRFDSEGVPVGGPPNRPLRILSARVRNGDVVVEAPPQEDTA